MTNAAANTAALLGVDAHDRATPEPPADPASSEAMTRDEMATVIRRRYGLPAEGPLPSMWSMFVESVVAQSRAGTR